MIPQAEIPLPITGRMDDDDRPWCRRCGTNRYLIYEAVALVPGRFDKVDVDYVCSKCESFCGHLVPTSIMDEAVLREFGIPYLNAGVDGYFHCGEVMSPTGERMPPSHARMGPHRESWQPPRRSPVKAVRCRCGFQIEVPD